MKLELGSMRLETMARSGGGAAASEVRAAMPTVESLETGRFESVRPVEQSREAVETLNRALEAAQRDLRFQLDEDSGRVIVQVVEPASGEVIRQIPNEEVLRMASRLGAGDALRSLGLEQWT